MFFTTIQVAQTCSLFSAPDGRVYRPRDCERLVLYLKDINLPRPDKYDTCMLIAFLQQLQTFGGFYDENLEFLRLERVHVRELLCRRATRLQALPATGHLFRMNIVSSPTGIPLNIKLSMAFHTYKVLSTLHHWKPFACRGCLLSPYKCAWQTYRQTD